MRQDEPLTVTCGEGIEIRALHADGAPYRWWRATVEWVGPDKIVVRWPEGTVFAAPTPQTVKIGRHQGRGFFWFDRPYTVVETYGSAGDLVAICADIASPARLLGKEIIYTDYELDVVMRAGKPVAIEDEDEFREAAILYGYSDAFQDECRRLVHRVREIVDNWIPMGCW